MATVAITSRKEIASHVLEHMLDMLDRTTAHDVPFSHCYMQQVFPENIYEQMMQMMPDPALYKPLSTRQYVREDGTSTRDLLQMNDQSLGSLPEEQFNLWAGITDALQSPKLKRVLFHKLAKDLKYRFHCSDAELDEIEAFPKPSLYRDLPDYRIAPHPDTRSKIITMQLYLPRDNSQEHFGTALYERILLGRSSVTCKRGRFRLVKQFPFLPNTGYAFVVNNTLRKKSWHGRELVPHGAGIRNTILNLYFAEQGKDY